MERQSSEDINRSKILIVEDHDETRYFLGLTLEDSYDVDEASSARETLEKPELDSYDLFLVDISLCDSIDGVELARRLRQRPGLADTPFIAMTAHIRRDPRDHYLAHGFDEYLGKPFFPEELLELVERLLADRGAGTAPPAPGPSARQ